MIVTCVDGYKNPHHKIQRFGNLICFCPLVSGGTPTLLGSLRSANLNHWPNRVGVTPPHLKKKQITFPKYCFQVFRILDVGRSPETQ
jgi:hypothetical protein